METVAVVLEQPGKLALRTLALQEPGADDIVVDALWSGISSGTERLLWEGRMPDFPGMGYPLVPGYETVGIVAQGGHGFAEGDHVQFGVHRRGSGGLQGIWIGRPAARAYF